MVKLWSTFDTIFPDKQSETCQNRTDIMLSSYRTIKLIGLKYRKIL